MAIYSDFPLGKHMCDCLIALCTARNGTLSGKPLTGVIFKQGQIPMLLTHVLPGPPGSVFVNIESFRRVDKVGSVDEIFLDDKLPLEKSLQ